MVGRMVSTVDVCRIAGISYRQADHWVRRGYVRPLWTDTHDRDKVVDPPPEITKGKGPGSGYARAWPRTEVQVVTVMRLLIDVGVPVNLAALMARSTVIDGTQTFIYANGVTINLPVLDDCEAWV